MMLPVEPLYSPVSESSRDCRFGAPSSAGPKKVLGPVELSLGPAELEPRRFAASNSP